MTYFGKVLTKMIIVRSGPGSTYSMKRSLVENDDVKIYEVKNDTGVLWGRIGNDEWAPLQDKKMKYIQYNVLSPQTRNSDQDTGQVGTTINTGEVQNTSNEVIVPAETFENVFTTLLQNSNNDGNALNLTMRLFGLPFQFRNEVDVRVNRVSNEIGRTYIDNIINKAPVVTIIPGKPKYLPGSTNQQGWTHAFMSAATGNFGELQHLAGTTDADVRYYDFEQTYTEYMKYVNILCRTAATFLELTDEIDGTPLQSYDWRNYRWNGQKYGTITGNVSSAVANGVINSITQFGTGIVDAIGNITNSGNASPDNQFKYTTTATSEEEDALTDSLFQTSNFVQFYMDPDNGTSESASNSTSESQLKGMFDTGSAMLKELAFVANSGGMDTVSGFQDFAGASANALADQITSNSMSSFLKRLLDVSGNVMKGENVIMPEIYNSSGFDRSFSINFHFKAPYGNKFCYYLELLAPLFHVLGFVVPKQTSANTYGSPFIIKTYVPGVHNCNLGIITGCTINKNVSPESWTVDGFPSEMDITLTVHDLYSDLTLSPQSSPMMFLNNASLIEYLATSCGLNLIQPQLDTRLQYTINAIKNAFGDIPENISAAVTDRIEELINPWLSIR